MSEINVQTPVSSANPKPNTLGPLLPPGFIKEAAETDAAPELYGPALPPGFSKSEDIVKQIVGPQLPPTFDAEESEPSSDVDDGSDDEQVKQSCIGPQLPRGFKKITPTSSEAEGEGDCDDDQEGVEDEIIGPLPYEGDDISLGLIQKEVEMRAKKMKDRLCGIKEEVKPEREEWMTAPPTQLKKAFGLGPRQFNRRDVTPNNDTSGWTSIPGKTVPKDNKNSSVEAEIIDSSREKAQNKVVEDFKAARSETLLDIHKKNLKRKGTTDKPQERRPFDRSIDLETKFFDDAQRKSVIKKSRQLNDRFSMGKSKFL